MSYLIVCILRLLVVGENLLWLYSMSGYFFSVLRKSLPAAGYRNGTTVNNVGSNGNYWSSTYNSNNNAYNFNFNSSNVNTSNNNRYNGHSVRLVQDFTLLCFLFCFFVFYV